MALKNLWMQKVRKRMEKKGTVGAFTRWCKQHGHKGATMACVREALRIGRKTKNTRLIKMAILCRTFHKYRPKGKK